MKVLEVKGVRVGEGRPKTIVSLMERDVTGLLAKADQAQSARADCLEWRADHFAQMDSPEAVAGACRELMSVCPKTPLIATLRTKGQGGEAELSVERHLSLLRALICEGRPDLVDIELGVGDDEVRELVALAHEHGSHAIVSHHDFDATPSEGEMESLLLHMAELGADIPKLAVMARRSQDAHALMRATAQAHEKVDVPLITMAMGTAGQTTRLTGEVFGSAMTFCALGRASAPGQVELESALVTLGAIHRDRTAGE
ncbi:MAG: type I 3-dehydroquinate dehydratase [Atopobiaceae bacterium]|nr:type I 3-dehydroquinate dehydratase [Atopobiaceae bacterium]